MCPTYELHSANRTAPFLLFPLLLPNERSLSACHVVKETREHTDMPTVCTDTHKCTASERTVRGYPPFSLSPAPSPCGLTSASPSLARFVVLFAAAALQRQSLYITHTHTRNTHENVQHCLCVCTTHVHTPIVRSRSSRPKHSLVSPAQSIVAVLDDQSQLLSHRSSKCTYTTHT